jgi:hypothetical protein
MKRQFKMTWDPSEESEPGVPSPLIRSTEDWEALSDLLHNLKEIYENPGESIVQNTDE